MVDTITLALAGDVMTGRGVDQRMPHPEEPELREPHVKDARSYVHLAEARHGPIPEPMTPRWLWGDALSALARLAPDAFIANLETTITTASGFWPNKAVHYRMHPDNLPFLLEPGPDVLTLANNHLLDFGRPGLTETLDTLARAAVPTAGAGEDLARASAPTRLATRSGVTLAVYALAAGSSGVPVAWSAGHDRSGVWRIERADGPAARDVLQHLERVGRPGELTVVSIHWGTNWGWAIEPRWRDFAHTLIDGGVALVHGHSSHHVRPLELYRGHLILYGAGDLVTDYEGIRGYEDWRGDLGALHVPTLDATTGVVEDLRLVPLHMKRFRLTRPRPGDVRWLAATLDALSRDLGVELEAADGEVRWVRDRVRRAG